MAIFSKVKAKYRFLVWIEPVSGQYENMIGSCLFLNGDIEKINGGADIFDSITEKKLVMSRCLLSKRTEKDETFFTGNTQEGK